MTTASAADRSSSSRARLLPGASQPAAAPGEPPAPVSAAALLAAESRVREAADETEIVHLIANESRKLIAARQVFVFRAVSSKDIRIVGISSLAVVDREAPNIRWLEAIARDLAAKENGDAPRPLDLAAHASRHETGSPDYPFAHALWQPARLASGALFGALLATRDTPWSEQDGKILARQARSFGGSWRALLADRTLQPRHRFGPRLRLAAAAVVGLALLFPVPMSVLAPVEIVASQPQRVTAPLDGVIASVFVEPNHPVKEGEAIVQFEQTTLANKLQLAERDLLVANARLDRVNQAAFKDEKARHEIALARAEYDLKRGERDYAADLYARSTVVAERSGLLVYADKDRLLGQPVKTGERLMRIVDPRQVEAKVELAAADAIVLEQNSEVRLFLDARPLSSLTGRLVSEGYMAEPNVTQQLVYTLRVALDPASERPRIGSRGIAQLSGQRVPLVFYLLRRPIAAARQHLGI